MYPEPQPSAPPLVDLLKDEESTVNCNYNCEDGCDVEFLVGKCDEDLIRIPVHSRKLSEYLVFKAMLSEEYDVKYAICDGGQRKLRQIRINWIDRKAFDNVMKFIYRNPVNLQATEMTVETLKAAHEFILPGLVRVCVKQLSKMISLSNVLFVFANVRYLCNDLENLEELVQSGIHMPLPKKRKHSIFNTQQRQNTANQHTDESQDSHFSAGLEMKNLCVWLLCQCLAFIDVHAVHVLESDEMEELDRSYVKFLLKRDSLDVTELAVFSALVRWAETECKRQHLPLTWESKRLVLHDLIYVVRFFQMSALDFLSGPGSSGLLSSQEVELINNILLHYHRPHFSTVTTTSGQTKRNLCSPSATFSKYQIQTAEELQALKTHWKYLSQPRTPRLNNGDIGDDKDRRSSSDSGKKRRKYSLKGTPKKSLMKFKRAGFLVKSFCIPCAYRRNDIAKAVVLINNDLSNGQNQKKSPSSQQNHLQGNTSDKTDRPRTLQRNESTLSKAFDYSLRAFAFFFD